MDRCIIYYDSISTTNTLDEVTVITLPTVKRFEKTFGEIICTMNRDMVFQKIRSSDIIIHWGGFYAKTLTKKKENKDACEPSRSKKQKGSNERELLCAIFMICMQLKWLKIKNYFWRLPRYTFLQNNSDIMTNATVTMLGYFTQPRSKYVSIKKVIMKMYVT